MNDLLRRLRLERGWSQEQLAEIAGLSVRTVQRAEASGTCSLETARALAAAFETTPAAFLSDEAEEAGRVHADGRQRHQVAVRVRRRLRFHKHLAVYLLVNALLFAIDMLDGSRNIWFVYPLLGWGIGLLFDGLGAYGPFGAHWEERAIERAVRAEREKSGRA